VEPVIAGIDPVTLEPFVANLDLIGCPMTATDFAVSGTCTEQMYGMCESLWVPDMVRRSQYCDPDLISPKLQMWCSYIVDSSRRGLLGCFQHYTRLVYWPLLRHAV